MQESLNIMHVVCGPIYSVATRQQYTSYDHWVLLANSAVFSLTGRNKITGNIRGDIKLLRDVLSAHIHVRKSTSY